MGANQTLIDQRYQEYLAERAKIRADYDNHAKTANEAKAIREARYAPRVVETREPHPCSICDETIPQNTKAWFTPSRIAAKSSRCSDPSFTGSRYTCMRCAEASQ